MKPNDKLCLVSGGSRGIGKGIVHNLSERGFKVAFTFNNEKKLARDIENEIKDKGGKVKSFQMSIENRDSVVSTLENIRDYFSDHISVLVNNAAIAQEKPFKSITDSDWERMLKVNLHGPFICTQEVLPSMIRHKWGRIINISSVGGQWGGYNQVHYAASKAALINFTQSIAKIYSKHGITSNAVAIGLVKTDMSGPELDTNDGKKKVADIPIGRVGSMKEIASTVKFLCSEDASYITGQTINANGGMYFS